MKLSVGFYTPQSLPSLNFTKCLVQVAGGVDDDIGLVEKRGGFGGHTSGGGLQRWARFLHACACISKLAFFLFQI